MERDKRHWLAEDHEQRITTKELREMLLAGEDILFYRGQARQLKGKYLGAGVYEISKEPLRVKA